MKDIKKILKTLEKDYTNIDYYYTIIEMVENNEISNPDIAIESCKSLLEGLSKFIWKQIDPYFDQVKVDKLDFHTLVKTSVTKLSTYNEDLEVDFVNKVNKLIVSIGEIRNKRGDISHGKLSPKDYFSDTQFARLVINITDSMLYYILYSFSKVKIIKELKYEDNPYFNEKLDLENEFGVLSYSKALFEQDLEAYKQELLTFLDSMENNN